MDDPAESLGFNEDGKLVFETKAKAFVVSDPTAQHLRLSLGHIKGLTVKIERLLWAGFALTLVGFVVLAFIAWQQGSQLDNIDQNVRNILEAQ